MNVDLPAVETETERADEIAGACSVRALRTRQELRRARFCKCSLSERINNTIVMRCAGQHCYIQDLPLTLPGSFQCQCLQESEKGVWW